MKPTYHIISHTHWDREWYRSFDTFRAMLVNMVDDLIELLKKEPSFRSFLLDGQTSIIEDYLEIKPERENELKKLISDKRLFIGPWYVLPDEFLVSAESLVRNLLMGKQVAEKLGGRMMAGYLPDSFGHIAMIPSILNGFGIDTAIIYRGFGGETGQNFSEYCWVSPDDTRCLMVHLPKNGYSGCYFYGESDDAILKRFAGIKNEIDSRATMMQRLILNGGDHHWPDPNLMHTLQLLQNNFEGNFIHSNLPEYFECLKKESDKLEEITGELRFGYRYAFAVMGGVYSSRMYIKQANWRTEILLERYAEPLHAFATALKMKSQLPLLNHAWKNLLHNHPHDSICGCSIDSVHREMMTRFHSAEEIGKAVVETSLRHLLPPDENAAGDDRILYFFNPSPFERSEIVSAELYFYLRDVVVGLNPDVKPAMKLPPIKGFRLLDTDGAEIPYQILDRQESYDIICSNYGYPIQTLADKFHVLINAKKIPPVGFKALSVEKTKKFFHCSTSLIAGKYSLENEYLKVKVSKNGAVKIIDKLNGNTYNNLNIFEDMGDVGDEYNYSYPAYDIYDRSDRYRAKISLIEKGPLRAALKIQARMVVPRYAASRKRSRSYNTITLPITTILYLTENSRALEIETTVENNVRDHRLRVLFPSGIKTNITYADSQYCIVKREHRKFNPEEFSIEHPAKVAPMQRFVTVKDSNKGLTVFSYGMPEYELKLNTNGTIALTLLRCVGTLAGDNLLTRPGGKAGWHNETPEAQCIGTHTFRYAVLPHSAVEYDRMEFLNRESECFHLPIFSIRRKNKTQASPEKSFISLSPGQIVLSAIKTAEDGKGAIIRVHNPTGKEIDASINFSQNILSASLVRLDEEFIQTLSVDGEQNIHFRVAPFAVQSIRVEI